MASLMENLVDVLEKESIEYEILLGLSMDKTPVIVAGDLEKLQKITDEEQLVIARINQLDAKREEVVKDIANVINADPNKVKLVDFIKMLEQRPAEQAQLAQAIQYGAQDFIVKPFQEDRTIAAIEKVLG